uniref:CBS domain-containing protein n=2 Tax=Plectus sambesii TaxID=2011161 RepID=A0A914UJ31_9BILA
MGRSVAKAAVGKWQELRTVTKDSSLRDAVELMVTEGLSSVPVVERPNSLKPTDVLCKADVVRLLATTKSEQPTNLYSTIMTATVDDALRSRDPRDNIDPPFCSFKDSVVSVIDKTLAYKDFRCIFALDDAGRLMGAISVSDLMRHIMTQRIRPPLTG